MLTASKQRRTANLLFIFTALIGLSQARAASQEITADIKVKLVPVVTNTDLVTDINVVDGVFFVCTQPGRLLRSSAGTTTTFLDLRGKVGPLGFGIPPLPGLGYPKEGTYDERGLLGFAADPAFRSNGRFWVWYTAILERSPAPPNFFQWLVSTDLPWNQSQYDHVGHLEEYRVVGGAPEFKRTVLKIKRPYFNHTGYQSLVWSPEHGTLLLGLGDGGSEYDPNNIAQDDDQLSGKLLKIDLDKLRGWDFTAKAPVATFSDLKAQGVDPGAFVALVKGLRNPSKVTFEETDGSGKGGDDDGEDGNGGSRTKSRWIKYLANTGQDTIEFIHGFQTYGINFGFRPWEGIFPTAFEMDIPPPSKDNRAIAYGLEASRLATVRPGVPKLYRPFVQYTHLDKNLGPNANTGSALYRGSGIPGLKGQIVFTDWISFKATSQKGLLMHAAPNRNNLQESQPIKLFDVDTSAATAGTVLFYTSINTDRAGERIFIGTFKNLQFITSQAAHSGDGGVYEVVKR